MSLRSKLLAVVGIVVVAFITMIVASALVSDEVERELETIKEVYVPRVALGPRLEGDLARLARRFQDAVAAADVDLIALADETRDTLLGALDAAGPAVDAEHGAALRRALADYHATADDVSRRLIAGELGERIIADIEAMQAQQQAATVALRAATAVDRDTLAEAFEAAAGAEATGAELRLVVSLICVALALAFSLWLARSVLRSLDLLTAGFGRFAQGHFDAAIPVVGRDELAAVAGQANEMAARLASAAIERERVTWLREAAAGLSDVLRGELEPVEAADRALRFLVRALDVPVAALYYADSWATLPARSRDGASASAAQGALELLAHHAHVGADAGGPAPRFALGEGLVGAAAQSRDLTVVTPLPPGYLRVRSGLGDANPAAVALLPLVYGERVTGVVEIATFEPWPEAATELLTQVRESISIALHVAHRRAQTRALLAETQAQAERLANQDEELRATNEELQLQQEELRVTNAELTEQAAVLERQQRELEARHVALEEARARLEQKASELATVSVYKSQFLTSMSHELRTPLNSMLLLSRLLADNEDGTLAQRQVDYCNTIYSAGRDLLGLINQVLDLARIESGKRVFDLAPVYLEALADRARRVFEPQARDAGLTLTVEIDADAPDAIITDRQAVDQILTNLLGNAIKFTPSGAVALHISRAAADATFSRPELGDDDVVAFAVRDTGPGIGPEQRERIFAPFEQLGAEQEHRYGGTGLGLALARELVGLIGGELQLESEVGRGSTFTCFLPATPSTAVRDVAPPRPASVDDARPRSDAGASLLVIEDDAVFAQAVIDLVHGAGLACTWARDARTGIAMAREQRPQGVVLDVRLPDLDGFTVMEALRADPATRDIPIHFASAVDARERGLALGAVGYLVKPASRDELKEMIGALATNPTDSLRVLVVEDDPVTGESLVRQLAEEGMALDHVVSAAAALEAIGAGHYDCVILDLGLPDMDGLDLLERLHGERDDLPPIVICTGRSLSREETQRIERYGETIVLKEGAASDRVLNEVRLFVRRIREGFDPRRAQPLTALQSHLRLDGRKVLLVDDDMRTVYALSAALQARGGEVIAADTGRAALDALERHRDVDIVLMDVMMPEMDGYEAMQRIRAQSCHADLPIIALTAKAMRGDAEKCIAAGASDYLPKPIDADRLFALITQRLESTHGGGSRQEPAAAPGGVRSGLDGAAVGAEPRPRRSEPEGVDDA